MLTKWEEKLGRPVSAMLPPSSHREAGTLLRDTAKQPVPRPGGSYSVAMKRSHRIFPKQTTQHTCQVPGNRHARDGQGSSQIILPGPTGQAWFETWDREPWEAQLFSGIVRGPIWGLGGAARLLADPAEARNTERIRAGWGSPPTDPGVPDLYFCRRDQQGSSVGFRKATRLTMTWDSLPLILCFDMVTAVALSSDSHWETTLISGS